LGVGFRALGFGFLALDSGFLASGFGFLFHIWKVRVQGSWLCGLRVLVSGCRCGVYGLGFRV
jgi:hypothetical protein